MTGSSNGTSFVAGDSDADNTADLALPLEPDAASTSTQLVASTTAAPVPAASGLNPTEQPTAEQPDNTVAVALVATILIVLVLFTVAYVLYQKRRRLCSCGDRQADKGASSKPDLSANEALITPVKANGGVESAPAAGLVSGPRESKTRQAVPRKWYDSAAIKYMDQSTDTLDRV